MRIEHVAIYVRDLEQARDFYTKFFQGTAGERYHNPTRGFTSYFLSFETGARLEIMNLESGLSDATPAQFGWNHIAFSVGSKEAVDAKTEELRAAGYEITGGPRTTGDGYYESTVLDPDGNIVEITI